ncbi:MAG: sugar ABC transporter permease [Planctomycetaceae bacterium]|nr:sugar ABC transporter permease [Planctomycetaceae bacterium]
MECRGRLIARRIGSQVLTLGIHNLSSRFRRNLTGLAFVSPWLLGLVLLFVYPFVASLYWSFCRFDLLSPPQFIGTEHYRRLGSEIVAGQGFGRAIWNTVYFASLSVPLSIVLGIGLATMLSWNVRGQSIYRTLFFLPSVVPVVASSTLWLWLLDPRDGIVNRLLEVASLPKQLWFKGASEALMTPSWFDFGSKDALVLMSLWGVGNFMVIYLAAIGDIPKQLYEAAELDGAGRVRRLWHVTLPMLSPVIFFNLVMGMIQSVQAFTQVYIVSEGTGEPATWSLMLSLHLFLSAFQDLDMGYASAMSWLLFVSLLMATAFLFRTSRHWVHYHGVGR